LHDRGVEILSVGASPVPGRRTPDGVISRARQTVEFKTLISPAATELALRRAQPQARVVVDGRTAGLDEERAIAALSTTLRRRGGDFDEIVLLLGDRRALYWP
jgi:hypothetical protein